MYDIEDLEKKWKKYQLKKRLPAYFGVVFVILLFIFFIKMSNFDIYSHYFTKGSQILEIKRASDKKINRKNLINSASLRLEVYNVDETKIKNYDKDIITAQDILVDIPILDKRENDVKDKKVYLNIVETTSIKAYEDVEKRFYSLHDIDDGLFLAKSYYKKQNYKKSEYWALQVNMLDENLEDAILIFAKSKVKLGLTNESISILKRYINKSNSEKAKDLLYKIDNNEL